MLGLDQEQHGICGGPRRKRRHCGGSRHRRWRKRALCPRESLIVNPRSRVRSLNAQSQPQTSKDIRPASHHYSVGLEDARNKSAPTFQGGSTGSNPVGATTEKVQVRGHFRPPNLICVADPWAAFGPRDDHPACPLIPPCIDWTIALPAVSFPLFKKGRHKTPVTPTHQGGNTSDQALPEGTRRDSSCVEVE